MGYSTSNTRFLILSEAHIVLNLNHIIYVQYNPELERASILLTNKEFLEVQPKDYNDLVGEIAHHSDYHLFKGVKKQ